MIKIGVVKNFDPSLFEDYLLPDFKEITRCGINYNQLLAFEQYIDDRFDIVFSSIEEFETWLNDFIYIIIPSEMIPQLTDFIPMVEDIDNANQFDVILSEMDITTRNGEEKTVICDTLKMTPCKCLTWDNGDDSILDGIIYQWNELETYRIIDFPCKFDSLADLEDFKALQK